MFNSKDCDRIVSLIKTKLAISKYLCICLFVCLVSACGGGDSGITVSVPETILPPTSALENTYYVAPTGADILSNGAAHSPWRTIQYGISQLNAGDMLIVSAGVYAERVEIEGENDKVITIRGEVGAIIDGSTLTPSGQDGLVTINNAKNFVFDGFEIRNFKTAPGFHVTDFPAGILILGDSSEIDIINNAVHGIENNSTCHQSSNCGWGANGIAVYGRTLNGIKNISFINNEVYNCKTGSSEAFVLNGNVDEFTVIDNNVHDNNNIGFDFIGLEGECSACSNEQDRARNGIVRGNRAVNNSTQSLGGNPWYGPEGSAGGIYVDGGQSIIIDGNFVSGNDIGIEVASEAIGQVTSNVLVINNVIVKNREAGFVLGGYNANPELSGGGGVDHILVHNNSFYKNQGWGTDIVLQYRVNNSQFYNNAVYASGSSNSGLATAILDDQHRGDLTWKHNLWWGAGTNEGAPVDPLSSLVADPLFINPEGNDLSVNVSSPLIDAGKLDNEVTSWTADFWLNAFPPLGNIPAHGEFDFDGQARNINTIDIGALEK